MERNSPGEAGEPQKPGPKVMFKSLSETLEEMNTNIETAAKAARRAEEAARVARDASAAATKASKEAEARAIEAVRAGDKAAVQAEQAVQGAAAKTRNTAKKVAEEVAHFAASAETKKFTYYQDGQYLVGWLEDYPDYRTQGETLDAGGLIPQVRKSGVLVIG
jgi:hypothetical protein